MTQQTQRNKKLMLEALEASLGIVSDACKAVKINRWTHYDWMKNDPEYREAVESISEVCLDHVESKMFQLINGVACSKVQGDELVVYETPPCKTSIIFYLNNKGKKRGYNNGIQQNQNEEGDRATITLPNGTQITI